MEERMRSKRWLIATIVAVFVAAVTLAPSASASHRLVEQWAVGGDVVGGAAGGGNDDFYFEHHGQHGPSTGHLPGSSENVDLVGRLKLTGVAGDISDVSGLQAADGKWYAYVGDWGAKCQTGGVHVVDISDPASPVKTGFLNSGGTGYVTEGLQALRIDTPDFRGDILVVSNEWCLPKSNPKLNPGGITIWDITDPTDPERLVQAFGDFDLHGSRANESHSAIAWDTGEGDAYVAAIDNEELEDVDLFDITDPRNPVKLAETDLPGVNVNAYGSEKTAHDFDVLEFPDGSWHLMVSDWDAGWIDVDVTDPSKPKIVGDFDYDACDRLVTTACPPEGNAHQGEWNGDASLFIGTDEDSSPFRLPIEVLDGDLAGQKFDAGEFGWTKQVASFPDEEVNGPTVFGGYGCPDDPVPPPSVLGTLAEGEEAIIVFERGPVNDPNHAQHDACFFSEKVRAGEEAGYDAVVIANHHNGAQGGELPEAFFCGGQGSPVLGTAAGLCVGHRYMHEAFGRDPDYTLPYPTGDPGDLEPNVGDLGPRIRATSVFDGRGCARLVDASAMTEIDEYCITEELDPTFAGPEFGDLTVHEVEVPRADPNEGGAAPDDGALAYFSWYAGGFRVASFDATGIEEVGHYIDPKGNNLWGVALAKDQNGDRIVLASDRDFGLFIFRYTGGMP
jgi:hypothetical protein